METMPPHYVLQLLFIEPCLKSAIFRMFTSSYEPTENHHLDLQLHLLGRIASTLLFGSFPPISYVVFQIQQTQ